MINFKHRSTNPGFSIIEVVLAITIVGTTLIALFGSLATSMRSVARGHQTVIRLYTIKNQIAEQGMQPPSPDPVQTIEKEIKKPKTIINYTVKNIPSESTLTRLKDIYLVQASGSWRTKGLKFKEMFISLIFAPKKQKK